MITFIGFLFLACSSLLFTTTAHAAAVSGLAARVERRQSLPPARSSIPMRPAPAAEVQSLQGLNTSQVVYSANWAGASWKSYPPGTFTSVTGEITVPTPKLPPKGKKSVPYSASAWVGIDGYTCQTALIQTGIDFTILHGKVTYHAWYEWWPAPAVDFTNFPIKAGEDLVFTVTATSTTSGVVTIKNKTTGKSVSEQLTSNFASLCLENADWIVEDFQSGGSQVSFADFGSVTFKHAVATTKWGSTRGPKGATILDLLIGTKVVTSVETVRNAVTVKYV